MPLVSVIIPTYNHRRYIEDALRSVYAQTFRDYEIIIVNDGSTDDTADILRHMPRSGSILLIDQTRAGQASARNRGLAASKGEFIAYLDSDDIWPGDKLEWQVRELSRSSSLSMVGGTISIINEDGTERPGPHHPDGVITFEALFGRNPFYSPGQTLIRADRLRAIGGFNPSLNGSDDFDAWFRLIRTGEILFLNRTALRYRLHGLNASNDILKIAGQALRVVNHHAKAAPPRKRLRLMAIGHYHTYKYAIRQILRNTKRISKSLSGKYR